MDSLEAKALDLTAEAAIRRYSKFVYTTHPVDMSLPEAMSIVLGTPQLVSRDNDPFSFLYRFFQLRTHVSAIELATRYVKTEH